MEAEQIDEEMKVLENMQSDAQLMMKKIKEDQEFQNAQKLKEQAEEMTDTIDKNNYSDRVKAQMAHETAI